MRFRKSLVVIASALLAGNRFARAIELDLSSDASIKSVSSELAYDMMSYYTGNRTGDVPGNLPDPYYWWEAGAMFGAMIDYWYYTGDSTYNEVTTQALLFQVGTNNAFMPPNQTKTLGNDDQAFWGLAAMSAAEAKFPNPPEDQPQWLALAQAVFNTQAPRWDDATCGGGLKWQIFQFNNGYNYKNTISNGCFFNLAARLAMYTGNTTYSDWAVKAWDWTVAIGLLDSRYYVFDGTDDTQNCSSLNHIQWSYNAGTYLLGAANMYAITNGSQKAVWEQRVNSMMKGIAVFFPDGKNIMVEVACENNGKCNVDQRSFKAYLARWMAAATKMAPFIHDEVMNYLSTSARAAALQCSGGANGRLCGMRWQDGAKWDGADGVGEQMAALEVIQSNLIDQVAGPVTNDTGGTSTGDYSAGSDIVVDPTDFSPVTTGDRVGAGFLTTFVLISFLGMLGWMVSG